MAEEMRPQNTPDTPRKSPCASCPYRRGVPSGIWDVSEYAKLPAYDAETMDQPTAAFSCHQGDGKICSGWLGFGDPADLLAVRLGVMFGNLDPSCLEYSTDVELYGSGAEAAEHGVAEISEPQADAQEAIAKISRVRGFDSAEE